MTAFKSVVIGYGTSSCKEAKIEFPGGMVYVTTGLTSRGGREVVSISVTADGKRSAGEPEWWAKWGEPGQDGGACRIIKLLPTDKRGKLPLNA